MENINNKELTICKKKTMGRRKIEIKKIEKKSSLQVTFSKRRTGLFRKERRSKYDEAVRKLEIVKRSMKQESSNISTRFWWDEPMEGMELYELEEYVDAMEALKDNVSCRVEEMEKQKSNDGSASTSDLDRSFQINYQDFDGYKSELEEMLKAEVGDDINAQMEKGINGSIDDDDDVLNIDELFNFNQDPTSFFDL